MSPKALSLFKNYDSIIVFDVETSGLNPSADQIVELAAVQLQMQSGKTAVSNILSTYIKLYDGHSIPSKVTQVNHITDQIANTQGISLHDACEKFLNLLSSGKSLVVAHNAQFDLSFLLKLFEHQNISNIVERIDAIDTLTVFKDRHSYPHKLSDAILAYNLQDVVSNSHRAIDDALALTRVLVAMDNESNDLINYVNIFGFNPKYPISNYGKLSTIRYLAQPYNMTQKLYHMPTVSCIHQSHSSQGYIPTHKSYDYSAISSPLFTATTPEDLEIMGDQLDSVRSNFVNYRYSNPRSNQLQEPDEDEMDMPDIADPDPIFESPIEDYPDFEEEIDERMDDNFYIGDGDDSGDDYY